MRFLGLTANCDQPEGQGADGAHPFQRQGTVGRLVEIHGKISGDGQGWIDVELEIKHEPARTPSEGDADADPKNGAAKEVRVVIPSTEHFVQANFVCDDILFLSLFFHARDVYRDVYR